MNAILNGLFGPSHVLHFLESDLHRSTGGGLTCLPGAAPSDQLRRRFPRRDVDRSRLDGEPWRPQA
jgi:hypothetical protein